MPTPSPSSSATATPSRSRASPTSSRSPPATRSSASGRRDLTLARMTPDLIYDQMIAAGVARKLDLQLARQPRRRRAERDPAADRGADPPQPRDRGVQPLRDGRRGTRPAPRTCRSSRSARYFETDLPKANPLIRPIESPYGDGHRLRRAAAQAGRDDRPRPARRRRRRHPGLGPARLPEGGRVRRRAGDRRGRGARRRGGRPGRPQPDDHPGPDRRRGRRRAVGRAPVVRPGRLRPRQPLLPRLGPDHAATRPRSRPGWHEWVYGARRPRRVPREARRRAARRAPADGSAPSGSVDYGAYR